MENIFDSHAHYTDESFDIDRDELLELMAKSGISNIIDCGTNVENSVQALNLCEKYDYIFAAVGVHPHYSGEVSLDYIDRLRELLKNKKAVAIGEIGLDYHYDFAPADVQKKVLSEQIELANEYSLPVILHDREAHGDMYELLRSVKPNSGVMHCFSGSRELARETLDLGLYIGLGGAVTFKNARVPLEVAAYVPLDRLLLETDAPYMTPVPFRGKRCDSRHIALSAAKIGEIRGISTDEVIRAARENAKRLFLTTIDASELA